MAGVEVVSDKIEVKVSAKRLWKTLSKDGPTFFPKALPEVIEKVDHEGGGEPGAIRTIYYKKGFSEAKAAEYKVDHLITFSKEKLLEVDRDALYLKTEVIEGGFLGFLVKKYTTSIRLEEAGPDASIVHYSFEYEALAEEHKQRIPHALKNTFTKGLRAAEAYLLSHDDY